MATQTSYQYQLPPEYVQERQKDLLLTLFGSQGQEPTLPDGSPILVVPPPINGIGL